MHVRLIRYGDRALLVETLDTRSAHRVAHAIEEACDDGSAPATVEDVVVGLASVVVLFDPHDDGDFLAEWLTTLATSDERDTDSDRRQDARGLDPRRRPDRLRRTRSRGRRAGNRDHRRRDRLDAHRHRPRGRLRRVRTRLPLLGRPSRGAGGDRAPRHPARRRARRVGRGGRRVRLGLPHREPGRLEAPRTHLDDALRPGPPALRAPSPGRHRPLHRRRPGHRGAGRERSATTAAAGRAPLRRGGRAGALDPRPGRWASFPRRGRNPACGPV